jgi:hypothetical protein
MATSVFLAKLLGPFFAVVGLSVLMNADAFRTIVKEFLKSPGLIFLTGLVTLPAGTAIVLTHNVWVVDWPVLITIIGWLSIISGIARILRPRTSPAPARKSPPTRISRSSAAPSGSPSAPRSVSLAISAISANRGHTP